MTEERKAEIKAAVWSHYLGYTFDGIAKDKGFPQPTMTTKKKIYIAGPMRGYPSYNFPAFDEAEAALTAGGWRVLSPAAMDRAIGFNPDKDEADEAFMIKA